MAMMGKGINLSVRLLAGTWESSILDSESKWTTLPMPDFWKPSAVIPQESNGKICLGFGQDSSWGGRLGSITVLLVNWALVVTHWEKSPSEGLESGTKLKSICLSKDISRNNLSKSCAILQSNVEIMKNADLWVAVICDINKDQRYRKFQEVSFY